MQQRWIRARQKAGRKVSFSVATMYLGVDAGFATLQGRDHNVKIVSVVPLHEALNPAAHLGHQWELHHEVRLIGLLEMKFQALHTSLLLFQAANNQFKAILFLGIASLAHATVTLEYLAIQALKHSQQQLVGCYLQQSLQ